MKVAKVQKNMSAADCEAWASYWLAEANKRQEHGLDDQKQLGKAQYWLDRANKAKGWQ